MRILAFDPGDTTGIAEVDGMKIIAMLQKPFDDCIEYIIERDWSNIDTIVCEDFRLFKNKAEKQAGSDFRAVQIIGALKVVAKRERIPIKMQMSSILPIAQKWTSIKMPSDHSVSHSIAALLHARFFQVENRQIPSVAQAQVQELLDERTEEPGVG